MTQSRSSGSSAQKRLWVSRMASIVRVRPLRQIQGEIGQRDAMARVVLDQERLHHGDRFATVYDRFDVRFCVLLIHSNNTLYINCFRYEARALKPANKSVYKAA